jgi:hypothetical protein
MKYAFLYDLHFDKNKSRFCYHNNREVEQLCTVDPESDEQLTEAERQTCLESARAEQNNLSAEVALLNTHVPLKLENISQMKQLWIGPKRQELFVAFFPQEGQTGDYKYKDGLTKNANQKLLDYVNIHQPISMEFLIPVKDIRIIPGKTRQEWWKQLFPGETVPVDSSGKGLTALGNAQLRDRINGLAIHKYQDKSQEVDTRSIPQKNNDKDGDVKKPVKKPPTFVEAVHNEAVKKSTENKTEVPSKFESSHAALQALNKNLGLGMKAVERVIDDTADGVFSIPKEYQDLFREDQISAFEDHINTSAPKVQTALQSLFGNTVEKGAKKLASKMLLNAAINKAIGVAVNPLSSLPALDFRVLPLAGTQDSPVTLDHLSRLYTWIGLGSKGEFNKEKSGYSYNEAFKSVVETFYEGHEQGAFNTQEAKDDGQEILRATVDSYIEGLFEHDREKILQDSFGGSAFSRWWSRNTIMDGNSKQLKHRGSLEEKFYQLEATILDENKSVAERHKAMLEIQDIVKKAGEFRYRQSGKRVSPIYEGFGGMNRPHATIDGENIPLEDLGPEYIIDEHMGFVYRVKEADDNQYYQQEMSTTEASLERAEKFIGEFHKQIQILLGNQSFIDELFTETTHTKEREIEIEALKNLLLKYNDLETLERFYPATKAVEKKILSGAGMGDADVKEWFLTVKNSDEYKEYFQQQVLKEEAENRPDSLKSIDVGPYKHAKPLDPNLSLAENLENLKTTSPDKGEHTARYLIMRSLSESTKGFLGHYIDGSDFDEMFLRGEFVDISKINDAGQILNMSREFRDDHDTLTTLNELQRTRGDKKVLKLTRKVQDGAGNQIQYDIFLRLECGGNPLKNKPLITINTQHTSKEFIKQIIPDLPTGFSINNVPRLTFTAGMIKAAAEGIKGGNDDPGTGGGGSKDSGLEKHDPFTGPAGNKGSIGGNGSFDDGGIFGWGSN